MRRAKLHSCGVLNKPRLESISHVVLSFFLLDVPDSMRLSAVSLNQSLFGGKAMVSSGERTAKSCRSG